ncbi:hypothetical protein [Mesorhizobium sp. M0587]|uniref:hypothetical protein n=1 Tax=Mesorhizobium sp. M0587 TaxID=2956964 RepID=UPI0033365AEA
MIVESSNCMKKAMATISATRRAWRAGVVNDWGEASFSGMAVMRGIGVKTFRAAGMGQLSGKSMAHRFEQHSGFGVHSPANKLSRLSAWRRWRDSAEVSGG